MKEELRVKMKKTFVVIFHVMNHTTYQSSLIGTWEAPESNDLGWWNNVVINYFENKGSVYKLKKPTNLFKNATASTCQGLLGNVYIMIE